MSELTERAEQVTALYFRVVLGTMFIFAILLSLELMANFQGLLWIPGVCFIAILLFQQIVKNSPPILIFSGTMSLYTVIPFVGDLSIGKTFTDLHEKVKKMIDDVCTMLALASLFLFVIYIDSDYSTQIEIAFYFFMGFTILAWWSAKTESQSKLIWKPVLVAGVLVALKGTALLYPMEIHETLGIYPGITVDKSAIKTSTKVIVQQDATIKNSRSIATISEFEKITTRLKLKTSAEIIRDRQTLLDMHIITNSEFRTIEAEVKRRSDSPMQKIIRKTTKATGFIKNIIADKPKPLWLSVGEMSYSPDYPGWTTKTLRIPGGYSKCRIICQQGYDQYYHDLSDTGYIGCTGRSRTDVTPKYRRFTKAAQLIQVNGIVSATNSSEFDCDDVVRASFMPNMQNVSENFIGNKGRPLFLVEKLQNPKT